MQFKIGKIYTRQELHDRFGGQRFGGISTPKEHPAVLLFTGEPGLPFGYRDGFQEDGTFRYTGEGQVGDMKMKGGNLAVRRHQEDGEQLHLFEILGPRKVRYLGESYYLTHADDVIAPDKIGDPRRAIVFDLEVDSGEVTGVAIDPPKRRSAGGDSRLWRMSLSGLREKALAGVGGGKVGERRSRIKAYERSRAVRIYVLRRANGVCESCRSPAPFSALDGRPYLEPHHIRRLADRGPDHPSWVIALCPNCHRRVHYGEDGSNFNKTLARVVSEAESAYNP